MVISSLYVEDSIAVPRKFLLTSYSKIARPSVTPFKLNLYLLDPDTAMNGVRIRSEAAYSAPVAQTNPATSQPGIRFFRDFIPSTVPTTLVI